MRRIVVTGAAGRVGSGIAAAFRRQGCYVVGVDMAPNPVSHGLILDEYVRVDLVRASVGGSGDHTTLRGAFVDADAVVHTAAWPGPSSVPPPAVQLSGASLLDPGVGLEACEPFDVLRDNVASTSAVCDAAVEANVRRFVFSSTAFTMGWCHAGRGKQSFLPRSVFPRGAALVSTWVEGHLGSNL